VTNETAKLCKEGTWQEMHDTGCNVFAPKVIANPGWFASIYSPELPGIGLRAALDGKPEN
jgi:ribose transport system substrate-binding protein